MPSQCHPKIVSRALLHSDETGPKSVVVAARTYLLTDGRTFLSVAHTKCPSGNYIIIDILLDIHEYPLLGINF